MSQRDGGLSRGSSVSAISGVASSGGSVTGGAEPQVDRSLRDRINNKYITKQKADN